MEPSVLRNHVALLMLFCRSPHSVLIGGVESAVFCTFWKSVLLVPLLLKSVKNVCDPAPWKYRWYGACVCAGMFLKCLTHNVLSMIRFYRIWLQSHMWFLPKGNSKTQCARNCVRELLSETYLLYESYKSGTSLFLTPTSHLSFVKGKFENARNARDLASGNYSSRCWTRG